MLEEMNTLRESILGTTPEPVLAISPNKLNWLYIKAEPLDVSIIKSIESGQIGSHLEADDLSHILQNHGWSEDESTNVWGFGPGEDGPNIFVNRTKGIQNLSEVRDYIVQGFRWSSSEGPLCGSPYYGIKFLLVDCKLAEDKSKRRIGQLMPLTRRACYGAILSSKPILLESLYRITVSVPKNHASIVLQILRQRRGIILESQTNEDSQTHIIVGQFSGADIIEIELDIQASTSGSASIDFVFNHWSTVLGYPLQDDGGLARQYVKKIRQQKGMNSSFPPKPSEYLDKK